MKILLFIILVFLGLLLLLGIIYFILLIKLKNLNDKLYKNGKEENLKEENILVVYQPSIHKTIYNLVSKIKEEIINTRYGYSLQTLSRDDYDYSKYEYVIFVSPVYFGQIHNEFLNKLKKDKIKKLLIVYNGLNKESNNEDVMVKKISLSKYTKIKLNTENIDSVREFIKKEVL